MPVSRNQIISEKFVFYILLAIVGLITALIPCIMLMLVGVAYNGSFFVFICCYWYECHIV